MKMKKLIYQLKPPCQKCPYTLGIVKTVVNPCPQCKWNGYQFYERFRNRMLGGENVAEEQ